MKRSLLTRRTASYCAAFLALGAVVAGTALAGSSSGKVFRACLTKSGQLYNVKLGSRARCRRHDKQVSWNQQGQRGTQGFFGPVGPQGSRGPAGATGKTGATGPRGYTGIQGLTGGAGPAGPRGATGAAGPTGPPGVPPVAQTASGTKTVGTSDTVVVTVWVTPSFSGTLLANAAAAFGASSATASYSCRLYDHTTTISKPFLQSQSAPPLGTSSYVTISPVGGEPIAADHTAKISLECHVNSGSISVAGNLNVLVSATG